jgi:MFS family permease
MTVATGEAVVAREPVAAPAAGGRYYALAILFLFGSSSLMDKTIIAYLLEPIKKEFALGDAALGLVSGGAFAVFFALAGLPMGWIADRVNRRNLVAGCLAAWSALTAAAGLAQSFTQLLLARIGVGIGEAGGGPAAMSMIADLFPADRRATAIGIYSLATPVGAIGAYLIASQVMPAHGWRGVFLAAGAPALILTPLLLTVAEPARPRTGRTARAPSFARTARFIAGQRSLLHLIAAITLTTVTMNGIGIWAMSYFIRIHHIDLGKAGPVLGFAYPIPAIVGTFAGGLIADRLARREQSWRASVCAIGALLCVPVTVALVLARDWPTTLALWCAYGLTAPIWSGPGYALSLSLVAPRMRGTQTAILFLLTNVVGFGLGPVIVGALSDAFTPSFGGESLRFAMLAIGLVNLWAALHFFLAGRGAARDLVRAGLQ